MESHDSRVRSSSRNHTVDERGDDVPKKGTKDEDVMWATWFSTEETQEKQQAEKKGICRESQEGRAPGHWQDRKTKMVKVTQMFPVCGKLGSHCFL